MEAAIGCMIQHGGAEGCMSSKQATAVDIGMKLLQELTCGSYNTRQTLLDKASD